jgi:hypothetical protein
MDALAGELFIFGIVPDPDPRKGRIPTEAAMLGIEIFDSAGLSVRVLLLPAVVAN